MHIKSGWHIGPSFEYVRCYEVHTLSEKSLRIGDTVEFYHYNYKIPKITNTHAIIETAARLKETVASTLTSDKNKTHILYNKHSKHLQSLSSILFEIANKH